MKKVIVNGAGVKLNNKWCFKGQEETITEEEYITNKEFVEVVEDIKETSERVIEIVVKDEKIDIEELKHDLEEYVENYKKEPVQKAGAGENQNPDGATGGKNVETDEELEALREEAKKIGIKGSRNMKKENLILKIEEIQKAGAGENQNPDGE